MIRLTISLRRLLVGLTWLKVKFVQGSSSRLCLDKGGRVLASTLRVVLGRDLAFVGRCIAQYHVAKAIFKKVILSQAGGRTPLRSILP